MSITASIDGKPVPHIDLDEATTLDEAAAMVVSTLSACAGPRRERVVSVRWHDGRTATRRIVAGE
jgi:hypothetical protein